MITGNAVVLELPPARLASRSLAFAIDLAVMLAVFLLLLVVLGLTGALGEFDTALAAAIGLLVTVSVFIVYPVTLETLTRGRSLGKMALGLRVVREDGGPIRFRHALVRGLAGFVVDFGVLSAFTGAIAVISSLASARGRRVGDALAGTLVVRERLPATVAREIGMPPELAAWAPALSLSQLPDPLALQARQFLQRAGSLEPRVRATLGDSLAGEVAASTSPAPPPGTPAEAYLAAVLAERRRREGDRLAAQRDAAAAPALSSPAPPEAARSTGQDPATAPPTPPVLLEPPTPPTPPEPPDGGFALPR